MGMALRAYSMASDESQTVRLSLTHSLIVIIIEAYVHYKEDLIFIPLSIYLFMTEMVFMFMSTVEASSTVMPYAALAVFGPRCSATEPLLCLPKTKGGHSCYHTRARSLSKQRRGVTPQIESGTLHACGPDARPSNDESPPLTGFSDVKWACFVKKLRYVRAPRLYTCILPNLDLLKPRLHVPAIFEPNVCHSS